MASAASRARGRVSLQYLLGALLAVEVPLRWRTSLAARGADDTAVRDSYNRWLEAERKGGTEVERKGGTEVERKGDTEVGGRRLRRWLEGENPRRPVDLPQYAPDGIDSRQDHIGVATEAEAFARLIASCDLTPPLAIALFGDWGSGKSFLMSAVQDRLKALTERVADRPQGEVRVWKRIKQIEFNAWEYVQGNLWASLLEKTPGGHR
jgi:KAP family P-loop domain